MDRRPFIVGMGGTTRPNSSSEGALRACLGAVERLGARTQIFAADALDLPMYGAESQAGSQKAAQLIAALRASDAIILSSPAYHGALSGLLKNALDYAEDLRDDPRPYFDARAIGCIVCAYGPQAMGTTLMSMRSIIHALRGWPTPMGVGVNSANVTFDMDGRCSAPDVQAQIDMLAGQIMTFANMLGAASSHHALAAQ